VAGNLQFDVGARDNASSTFAAVGAELKELGRQLDRIDGRNVRARVTVDGISTAQTAQLDRVKVALGEIDGRTARARVDVTGVPDAPTTARLRAAAKALRELDGINAQATVGLVGNVPNATELRRAARALKDLRDVGAIVIDIRITGDVDALARIAAVRRALGGIPRSTDTTVNVDVDRGVAGRLNQVGTALAKFGAFGGIAAAGAAQATAAAASLAGSLVSLVGLAPVAVGALAGLGAVSQTVKLGSIGMADAFKALADGKMDKFAEAVAEMSTQGKAFAQTLVQLKGPFDDFRRGLQDKLFDGFSTQIKALAGTYLPSLKSGMGGVATQLNGLAKDFVGFATSATSVRDVDVIFRNTSAAVQAARPGVINLASAFRDVAVVGTSMLPQLATGWTNATARFADFIAKAKDSGQLQQWIQGGIDTLRTLGSIAGNVGSILGSVFVAAKASGADFLTTLDTVTAKLAELLRSSTGQSSLAAFFRESRAAIDALMPGVEALATGVLKLIASFSTSGGLSAFASTLSQVAQTIAPLLPMLGQLAGSVLRDLANGASVAATALSPIVGLVTGILGVLGPLPALILASVVAFKALGGASALLAGLSTRIAALAPAIGLYATALTGSLAAGGAAATATTKFATALGKAGSALPIVGVGLVALGFVFDEFGSKADDLAGKVLNGSMTIQQAMDAEIAQLERGTLFWFSDTQQQEAHAAARQHVTDEINKQRAAMGPMQQLQSDVARGQAELNDAVARYGERSPQATAAAAALAAAQGKLKDAQDGAARAAMTHTQALQAQADQMRSQIDAALAYAEAVKRTADAQKAANDALKASGAKSDEYKAAVLDLARAMSSQADAARKQAEALGGTEAGVKAYNTELLRSTNISTQAGRDAFIQLASSLDNTGIAALNSAAEMSGLRTEIVKLPDGRTVKVVVAADRAQLDSVVATANDFVNKKYVGTVTLDGDPTKLGNVYRQQITLIDGTTATMILDGNGAPLEVKVGQSKYKIDATTGVMTIDGNPGPGEANLSGLKVHVDATTGVMTIDGRNDLAMQKTQAVVTFANGSTGTLTIDGNPTLANGKITSAVTFADGSKGTMTVDANEQPANGKITATVHYADGSTGTVKVDANTAAANAAIDYAARPRYATINVNTVYTAADVREAHGGAIGGIVHPMAAGGIVPFAGGGVALTPMSGGIAQIVPANSWRVIGDRARGDEFYLPDDSSSRSMRIGAEWARRRGLSLVPQQSGGVAAAWRPRLFPGR
jgi:hypothetical protein